MQGRASREDVAPQSCCYWSKTVESGGQHGLVHCHGGATMRCSATDQVASFTHSPVESQNFDVECSINCLTRRNKFFVNNSLLIKETNQHWLDVASHLPCLVRSRWPRTFPLTGLCFGFWVVGVNLGFVTRNYIRKKAGVISSIFFEVQANVKSLLFLVDTQETGHELWCDKSHLQIFC